MLSNMNSRRSSSAVGLSLLVLTMMLSFVPESSASGSPSCIIIVPSESVIFPSLKVVAFPNSTVFTYSALSCFHVSPRSSADPNIAYGYLSITGLTSQFTYVKDSWSVPPSPSNGGFSNSQNVLFWNGMETPGGDVMQPALVYGCERVNGLGQCTYGGNYWYITACTLLSGTELCTSGLVRASQGDSISGTVTFYPTPPPGCSQTPGYVVTAKDNSLGQSETLTVCQYEQFQTAMVGSLEENGLTSCNQLPNTTSEQFSSISYTTSPSGLTVGHGMGSDSSSLSCSQGESWNSGYTTLTLMWTP